MLRAGNLADRNLEDPDERTGVLCFGVDAVMLACYALYAPGNLLKTPGAVFAETERPAQIFTGICRGPRVGGTVLKHEIRLSSLPLELALTGRHGARAQSRGLSGDRPLC